MSSSVALVGRLALCLVIATMLGGISAAEPTTIELDPATSGVRLGTGELGEQVLEVSISELRLDAIEIKGQRWAVVTAPEAFNLAERGRPSLPLLKTEYLLGDRGGIDLELVDSDEVEIDLGRAGFAGVAPSLGRFSRADEPPPWIFDASVYEGHAEFPSEPFWVDDPFIAGPLRGQSARIPVIRWRADTNTLIVRERLRLRVIPLAEAANPRRRAARPLSGLFAAAARQHAVNAEQVASRFDPFVETGRLLILTADAFKDAARPLADWETLIGYPTLLVALSDAGIHSAAEIKQHIQGLYNEPAGLTWIILVGDYEQIPNLAGVNEGARCDPCYTKLEGDDNRPDAAISRISAQTEAEVTTQVNKILGYEQYPSTGSAATWYTRGFGIGGDDDNVPPADWERMELLRKDIVTLDVDPDEPHYSYTELDQIYHSSASSAQVTTSVTTGTSLGLYIGHGSELSWSTTGFSVSRVHELTNTDMLPVIWSVACLNGSFHAYNECFAESWLRKADGGAVSFEGATTNEEWVPPCIAQRGIIDAIRLETAFTTGGQHVSGKLHVMDVEGDDDSSSGTQLMEQSTLFGACTLWPRTAEPVIPDEPLDYQRIGDEATLTVTVGGQPLTKAGGAIVSFFTRTAESITLLGSGLTDAAGVVHATVTGDPTHCHIHGNNLIPQEVELAARPEGSIALNAATFHCTSTVGVRVSDSNVPGSSPSVVDTIDVSLGVPGSSVTVTLVEDAADKGIYRGTATLGTDLMVSDGQTLTASYLDADDGTGGTGLVRTDTADLDCAGPLTLSGPQISQIDASSALVSWTTNEPGRARVVVIPGGMVLTDSVLETSHALRITNLDSCSTYTVQVSATDALGNPGAATLSDSFTTREDVVVLEDDMESGPGDWTVDTATGSGTTWTLVDDGNASSPTHAWFSSDDSASKDDRLVSDASSISGTTALHLWHQHDTELGWDGGVLEVSVDGGAWEDVIIAGGVFMEGGYTGTIRSNASSPLAGRDAWTGASSGFVHTAVDLTAFSGTSVRLRLRLATDGYVGAAGWWVDDVSIITTQGCQLVPEIFTDGFETGGCSHWSTTVGSR